MVPIEQQYILSSLSPSRGQKRLAFAVVLIVIVIIVVAEGPLSTIRLGLVNAFFPIYASATFVIDLITAALLFAQFSVLRSLALLALANGYFFTSLTVIQWLLTFPGVLAPMGVLGGGLQTTTWIYIFWHSGFAVSVVAYALLKDASPTKRLWRGSTRMAILLSLGVTASIVCAATFVATAGDALLPHLMLDAVRFSPLWFYAAGCLSLLCAIALVVLWIRRRTVLDLWLMVVMCAYIAGFLLISFPAPIRFTVAWYCGRICGILASSLVLFVLLYEITLLYGQLLRAAIAQRREREARLLTGEAVAAMIAHEVRQPLSAMVLNADVGVRWLDRPTPDLDKATAAFRRIATDGSRAAMIVERVRFIFRKDGLNRAAFNVNTLVKETVALIRDDLQQRRILVQVELKEQLPKIIGDKIQLQQVLLNLITNAADSMSSMDEPRILSVRSDSDADSVKISILDTGTGN